MASAVCVGWDSTWGLKINGTGVLETIQTHNKISCIETLSRQFDRKQYVEKQYIKYFCVI